MKRVFGLFFAISIVFIFSAAFASPYKEISAEELVKMKKETPSLIIIDSRGGDWFDGTLIEGATQLDPAETNAETLAKIAPDKSQPVVFYCANEQCPASSKAAYKAAEIGYNNLYKYPGGIEGWKKLNLPTITLAKKD